MTEQSAEHQQDQQERRDPGVGPDGTPDGETSPHVSFRTGAEGPVDAEDLTLASGRDATPENLARAQERLDREGPHAIDTVVPD